MVVVAIELGTKDLSVVLNHGDVFPGAGADDPILEPAMGTFGPSFGRNLSQSRSRI